MTSPSPTARPLSGFKYFDQLDGLLARFTPVRHRLADTATEACDKATKDLALTRTQLVDYERRIGKPFTHADRMEKLLTLRDQLKAALATTASPVAEGEPAPPTSAEIAERIKAVLALKRRRERTRRSGRAGSVVSRSATLRFVPGAGRGRWYRGTPAGLRFGRTGWGAAILTRTVLSASDSAQKSTKRETRCSRRFWTGPSRGSCSSLRLPIVVFIHTFAWDSACSPLPSKSKCTKG